MTDRVACAGYGGTAPDLYQPESPHCCAAEARPFQSRVPAARNQEAAGMKTAAMAP